jgi:hypothetical protein
MAMTKEEALAIIAAQPAPAERGERVSKVGTFGKKPPSGGGAMLFLTRPVSYKLAIPGRKPAAVHSDAVTLALAGKPLPSLREYTKETLLAAVKHRKDDLIVLLGEALLAMSSAAKT